MRATHPCNAELSVKVVKGSKTSAYIACAAHANPCTHVCARVIAMSAKFAIILANSTNSQLTEQTN